MLYIMARHLHSGPICLDATLQTKAVLLLEKHKLSADNPFKQPYSCFLFVLAPPDLWVKTNKLPKPKPGDNQSIKGSPTWLVIPMEARLRLDFIFSGLLVKTFFFTWMYYVDLNSLRAKKCSTLGSFPFVMNKQTNKQNLLACVTFQVFSKLLTTQLWC